MKALTGKSACLELIKWYRNQYDVSESQAIRLIRDEMIVIKSNE